VSSKNDVNAQGEGSQGFFDNNDKALVVQYREVERRGSKKVQIA